MSLVQTVPFTGSYRPEQTVFLLEPMAMPNTPVEEKERLIQTGRRHYSEMITRELAPAAKYAALFRELTARHKRRLAGEINTLADLLAADSFEELTLVSLARAGTPIGALLQRALELRGRPARHYSVSIILGRGIDQAALRHLLGPEGRAPGSLRFIDGWTAKGSIGAELRTALAAWNSEPAARRWGEIPSRLHVVMDLGGTADVSATLDDYAIPCGILNATVSGLVSRTVLPLGHDPASFHGCVYYGELAADDLTQWFYDEIAAELPSAPPAPAPTPTDTARRRAETRAFLDKVQRSWAVDNPNRIKPGVAEATRAVLRRNPERVFLRDPDQLDVAHLTLLAEERGLPVEVDPSLPFNAFTLIRKSNG